MRIKFLKAFLIGIILFFAYSIPVSAQDTIYHLNSNIQVAKILEVGPKLVKYKSFNNPEGPLFIIDRRTISRIVYSNGEVDTFSTRPITPVRHIAPPPPPKPRAKSPEFKDYGKNTIFLSVSDPFIGLISGGYERRFSNGFFSFNIPVSFGLGYVGLMETYSYDNYAYYSYDDFIGYLDPDKIFSVGLDLNYFPAGQRTAAFFFGPAIEYGMFNYPVAIALTTSPPVYEERKETGSYSSLLGKAGFTFHFAKQFNASAHVGTGIGMVRRDNYPNGSTTDVRTYYSTQIMLQGGIQIGYRF